MCPRLRVVQLQGVVMKNLTDDTLIAFLSRCPDLTSVEITGESAAGISDVAYNALREHAEWAPKLKN